MTTASRSASYFRSDFWVVFALVPMSSPCKVDGCGIYVTALVAGKWVVSKSGATPALCGFRRHSLPILLPSHGGSLPTQLPSFFTMPGGTSWHYKSTEKRGPHADIHQA